MPVTSQTFLGGKPVYIDVNFGIGTNTFPELLYDTDAIRGSIYNILTTPVGTRAFVPEYGSLMYQFIHEPLDDISASHLEVFLIQALEKWEPRIEVVSSQTYVTITSNGFDVNISYILLSSKRQSNFEMSVSR